MAISVFEKCSDEPKDEYSKWKDEYYKPAISYAALCLFYLDRLDDAIEFYTKSITLQPTPYNHHNLACCYRIKGDYKLAKQHFKNALKIKSSASTYADYGLMQMNHNKMRKATKLFINAISLSNDVSSLEFALNEQLLLDEHLQQEISATKNFLIKAVVIAHYWLIQCYQQLDDKVNAKLYLEKLKALAKETSSAETNRLISYLYRSMDKEKRADKYWNRATAIKNNSNKAKGYHPTLFKPENSATEVDAKDAVKQIKKESLSGEIHDKDSKQLSKPKPGRS